MAGLVLWTTCDIYNLKERSTQDRERIADLEETIQGLTLSARVCDYLKARYRDIDSYKSHQLQGLDWRRLMERSPDLSLRIVQYQQSGGTGYFWDWVRTQCFGVSPT